MSIYEILLSAVEKHNNYVVSSETCWFDICNSFDDVFKKISEANICGDISSKEAHVLENMIDVGF